MEKFTELESKVINRLGDMVQKNELSNECLVKIIEELGGFLNLKTISDYSKTNPISYNGAIIKSDIKSLNALYTLQSQPSINYKCVNGYYTFTSNQLKDIFNMMQENIQKYFNMEMEIYKQINSCESISDFFNINYDF
jgi:hypothetical protein